MTELRRFPVKIVVYVRGNTSEKLSNILLLGRGIVDRFAQSEEHPDVH